MWTLDENEIILLARRHGRTFDFREHGPSSRPVLTFFIVVFFFFSFFLT